MEQKTLTSRSETSTRHEARDDRIPHVLLLPPALHSTVERREHATPNTKVATCYRRASFDDRQCSHKTIALRDKVNPSIYVQAQNKRTLGEFLAPLIPCQMVPPTAPIAKALPKSERITQGL